MPILDHLSPEILDIADFDSFHSQWASKIVAALNKILPRGFRAKAHTSIGTREVDVRTDRTLSISEKQRLISQYRIPDSPIVSEATFPRILEVFVDYIDRGRQITVGVVEIVSRANKDRPGSRDTFVAKCSNLLSQNVSLVVVDTGKGRKGRKGGRGVFLPFLPFLPFPPIRRNVTHPCPRKEGTIF